MDILWIICFSLSLFAVAAALLIPITVNIIKGKIKISIFKSLFAGVFFATFLIFFPINKAGSDASFLGMIHAILLSVFESMQIFTIEAGYELVAESLATCPDILVRGYSLWSATLFVIAPIFTFGFVLSLFKNISSYIRYLLSFFKDAYIFSELNEKSLVLASDLKKKNKNSIIVFNDVFEDNDEAMYELTAKAREMGAICFKKDILVVKYKRHSKRKRLTFFAMRSMKGNLK